ncbi:MAG: peptidylprolyl isomerase [Defluviitaleaceae bacterium]|nr:peptidylprolyl isomerase [Defluviitaleaceae bacterium]
MNNKKKKKNTPQVPDRRWMWLGIATIATAIIAAITVGLVLWNEHVPNPTVASFRGADINAADVEPRLQEAEGRAWANFDGESMVIEDTIRQEAVRLVAMDMLIADYAAQNGIALSPEHLQGITQEINDMIANAGGLANWNQDMQAHGFRNRQQVEAAFQNQDLMMHVISTIMDSPELFAEFEPFMEEVEEVEEVEEYIVAATHILAAFDNFDSEEVAHIYAEELLQRALDGEDFNMLVAEYGQDPGMIGSPEGYTFVEGAMVPEFYEATRALEMGGISGLVRSDFGYHIIMRVEPNLDDVMRPWGSEAPTLEDRMWRAITTGFEAKLIDSDITFRPALSNIEVD